MTNPKPLAELKNFKVPVMRIDGSLPEWRAETAMRGPRAARQLCQAKGQLP